MFELLDYIYVLSLSKQRWINTICCASRVQTLPLRYWSHPQHRQYLSDAVSFNQKKKYTLGSKIFVVVMWMSKMNLFVVALNNEETRAAVKPRPETNIRSLKTEFKVVSSIVGRHLARMGKLKYTKVARCKKTDSFSAWQIIS